MTSGVRGQHSAKALLSQIDLGQLEHQNTYHVYSQKFRRSSLEPVSLNPKLLDDYKMGLTITQGARKPQNIGPGMYKLPSIFENSATLKTEPRFSFSRCSREKSNKAVLSIKHVSDYLGKESPGTAYYSANYEPVQKHERVTRIKLTEDRFGTTGRANLKNRSPGPVYNYTHTRDISSKESMMRGTQFSSERRFVQAKKSTSPAPKYALKSIFGQNKRGAVFGTETRDTRDPRLRATVGSFKTMTQEEKKKLLLKSTPGPGEYHSPAPVKQNFNWSFSKDKRFRDSRENKTLEQLKDEEKREDGMRRTGSISFPKRPRKIEADLWDASYMSGSVSQI